MEDVQKLEHIFYTIQILISRLNDTKHFSGEILQSIETECGIDHLLYTPSIYNSSVNFDKYLKYVESNFENSSIFIKIRYLFNLRETLSNLSVHIKSYNDELQKLKGEYLTFSYKTPKKNSREEYKRLMSKCIDSHDHIYTTYWH